MRELLSLHPALPTLLTSRHRSHRILHQGLDLPITFIHHQPRPPTRQCPPSIRTLHPPGPSTPQTPAYQSGHLTLTPRSLHQGSSIHKKKNPLTTCPSTRTLHSWEPSMHQSSTHKGFPLSRTIPVPDTSTLQTSLPTGTFHQTEPSSTEAGERFNTSKTLQ